MPTKVVIALAIALLTQPGCMSIERYHLDTRVHALVETEPVPSSDDAADDPAIWVAPNPADSLVIGTDKGSGLLAYNLEGKQVQYLPVGELNNVDLRQTPWGMENVSLLAATQRNPSRIVLFTLDHVSRKIETVASHETELFEPYGLCMMKIGQQPYVVANGKSGEFIQYAVDTGYALSVVRRWRLDSQPEGCVVDDHNGTLFVGEEEAGVWLMSADPDGSIDREMLDAVGAGVLVADVEGMGLIKKREGTYLVVSSQGDNSFAVYDTGTRTHQFSFHVTNGDTVDGASETDGLEVTSTVLPGFPGGLLVVQDGYNLNPAAKQNFKMIAWGDVLAAAQAAR